MAKLSSLSDVRDEPHLSAYNQEVLERQPLSLISDVQTLVDEVNTSVDAFVSHSKCRGRDTTSLYESDFTDLLHLEYFEAGMLDAYRTALSQLVS